MKQAVIGILAHVDAGKTTLTEAMLHLSGEISTPGRVDKGSSVLDNHRIERERGITVFSKQARMRIGSTDATIIDTPGHIDFACETERAFAVEDAAVLVISATDGVEAHSMTLWRLLRARRIPTFIFVNKTDLTDVRRIDLCAQMKSAFGPGLVDFNLECEDKARFLEDCASVSEALMQEYFNTGSLTEENIRKSINSCELFPCIFGSALKEKNIDLLLSLIDRFSEQKPYSKTIFGAKVYKISTAADGTRLTFLKITGGTLTAKDTLKFKTKDGIKEEKVESIRLYSADRYKTAKSATAGTLCAIPNLRFTAAGMGLGSECDDELTLTPVLDYKVVFPKGTDVYDAYLKLLPLSEEEPSLAMRYDNAAKEIRVRLMGSIQTQILTSLIKERFSLDVSFGEGSILYKETISDTVYGAGHFEPLSHYAEVRLRLEPLPAGTGLIFDSECTTDLLKGSYQRLVISHLEEKAHKGVLTGAPITDMKITLISGRAHPKHTDGGDFREATLRALRQGLMKAESTLLEPTFDFTVKLPSAFLGRVMTDVSNMHGYTDPPLFEGDNAILTGYAPVYGLRSYPTELRAYTHGEGSITMSVGEYIPCHNAEEIITEIGYNADLDDSVSADSIFCKGGAGYTVPWYESDEKMHTEPPFRKRSCSEEPTERLGGGKASRYRDTVAEDKELMRIFEATYGKIKRRTVAEKTENKAQESSVQKRPAKQKKRGEDYLIIDGYNLIYASGELSLLAKDDLAHARDTLIRLLCNYRGFKKCNLTVVFDAYRREGNEGSLEICGGVTVVYTRERQTADAYIERMTHELAGSNTVRVVTSDYTEQLMILGSGALRVSAAEFLAEMDAVCDDIRSIIQA